MFVYIQKDFEWLMKAFWSWAGFAASMIGFFFGLIDQQILKEVPIIGNISITLAVIYLMSACAISIALYRLYKKFNNDGLALTGALVGLLIVLSVGFKLYQRQEQLKEIARPPMQNLQMR